MSEMLLEQVGRLHSDAPNKGRGRHVDFDPSLWAKVEEPGLPLAMCAQADRGYDLGWSDLSDVIAHSAACGEPTPLGETPVASKLLSVPGMSLGAIAFATRGPSDRSTVRGCQRSARRQR